MEIELLQGVPTLVEITAKSEIKPYSTLIRIQIGDTPLETNFELDAAGTLVSGNFYAKADYDTTLTVTEVAVDLDLMDRSEIEGLLDVESDRIDDLEQGLAIGDSRLSDLENDHSITAQSVKTLYESNPDRNALTDVLKQKILNSLESETVTTLQVVGTEIRYTNEIGQTTVVDMSVYLDDTNLSRIMNGSLDANTGIATFFRDDNSSFTVDFSAVAGVVAVNDGSFDETSRDLTLNFTNSTSKTINIPESTVQDTGWIPLVLENGWVNYGSGYATAKYRIIDNKVYIEGLIKSGDKNKYMSIIPVSARPAESQMLTGLSKGKGLRMDIKADGKIYIYGGDNQYVSLNTMYFLD